MDYTEYVEVSRESLTEVCDRLIEILLRKNHDYGDAWQVHGIAGVLVRMSDKAIRLKTLEGKEALVVEEDIQETLEDFTGYGILALLKQYGKSS